MMMNRCRGDCNNHLDFSRSLKIFGKCVKFYPLCRFLWRYEPLLRSNEVGIVSKSSPGEWIYRLLMPMRLRTMSRFPSCVLVAIIVEPVVMMSS